MCERYNCSSDGDCRADYEYCSVTLPTTGYCRAEYIVNATTMKIELYSKGCLQIQYENLFNISSECHIDNHLDSPAGAVLVCTCNGSLCNQNITFTHPTRHAKYGEAPYFVMFIPAPSAWIQVLVTASSVTAAMSVRLS